MPPPDRLADLLAMSQKTPNKPLVWYGLAMEYRSRGLREDAMNAFKKCTEVDPAYVPAYFQGGVTLEELGRRKDAIEMLEKGIAVARNKGDQHAADEMSEQLELWR